MYYKTYSIDGNKILACADKKTLGKRLVEGNYDVTVTESFYKGKETTGEELAKILGEFDSINLFGENAVAIALKQGLIKEKDIITIQGVKHAIIMKV